MKNWLAVSFRLKARWIQCFNLFFRKEAFVSEATSHLIRLSFSNNQQLRDKYPDERLPPEKEKEFRESISASVDIIRHSVRKSLILCLVAVVFAGAIVLPLKNNSLGSLVPSLGLLSGMAGVFLVLWATLGVLGWEIQTVKGRTLPEELNKFWFRLLYFLGTVLIFVSLLSMTL